MSDVYCFKCKEPLDVVNEFDEDEEDYLDEEELSKGKCPKCGRIGYFRVEWIFTLYLPTDKEVER